ncbi:MAG: ABC transporter ATP-binding protein [Gammaproteobacteria bacterium]|nr:ABC transporter ATP-binding protein [Gammaproteobacteria bacterium]
MLALAVHNLVKTYPNGMQALRGVDLEVSAGDFFALLGPNGAGKTTLIGIITSLVTKTSGEVQVFGHSIDTDLAQAKSSIGVVPQEININYWETVMNIVTTQAGFYGMGAREARLRAEECLRQLQLWDRRADIGRNLSGGMKRRLMIARALMHRPPLLILDEPTAGVDIEIRRSMWEFLREINAAGTTIILTTHYLEEAEMLCRNVAIINHGRIIEQGRMGDVLHELQAETFVLNLREAVAVMPVLPGYAATRIGDHEIEVEVTRGQDLNDMFAALSAAGLHVTSMRNKANRLEELFIHLTGQESQAAGEVRP